MRRKLPIGRFVDEQVVVPLRRQLGLQVDSGIVQHICGVFDTNAFAVSLDNDRCGRGLFPLGALMNHSCTPNTQHWYKDGVLMVRAVTEIPKGTPLTNTYTPTLWGTQARAAQLAGSKLFTCTCERCSDPTELGSHVSSVVCRGCQDGLLVPPHDPRGTWECHKCGNSASAGAVEAMVRAAGAAVSRVSQGDAAALGTFVQHLSKVVGGGHYITVELKYALVLAIMTTPLSDVTEADLSRAVSLSTELLQLAACIDPGMSRFRGVLLLELVKASTELLIRRRTNSVASSTTINAPVVQSDGEGGRDLSTAPPHTLTTTDAATTATCYTDDVQDLLKLLEECEMILLYDARLGEVVAHKHLLQHLSQQRYSSGTVKGSQKVLEGAQEM